MRVAPPICPIKTSIQSIEAEFVAAFVAASFPGDFDPLSLFKLQSVLRSAGGVPSPWTQQQSGAPREWVGPCPAWRCASRWNHSHRCE
jgi:hypothetical protein